MRVAWSWNWRSETRQRDGIWLAALLNPGSSWAASVHAESTDPAPRLNCQNEVPPLWEGKGGQLLTPSNDEADQPTSRLPGRTRLGYIGVFTWHPPLPRMENVDIISTLFLPL